MVTQKGRLTVCLSLSSSSSGSNLPPASTAQSGLDFPPLALPTIEGEFEHVTPRDCLLPLAPLQL
jgi:hypothetical protein